MPDITDAAHAAAEDAYASIYGDGREDPKPEDEGDKPDPEGDPDDSTGADPEAETETTETETEATPDEGEGTDPIEEFLGVDLSVLPASEREALVSAFTEQNKLISQLQRERAADEGGQPDTEQTDEPVTFTDEELMEALGIDPEASMDPERDKREVALARELLSLKNQVEGLTSATSAEAEEKYWESSLDKLEAEFGPLPVKKGETAADTRLRLYEMAAERSIGDPEAAYWRFMGPVRAQLSKDVEKRLSELKKAGKKAATTQRPKASEETEEVALTAKDTRDAVREAAKKAAEKLGIDWEDARKSSLRRTR